MALDGHEFALEELLASPVGSPLLLDSVGGRSALEVHGSLEVEANGADTAETPELEATAAVGTEEEDELQADIDQDMRLRPCLPVGGGPLPPSEEPATSADEYLRRVQWERLKAPAVVEAEGNVEERAMRRAARAEEKQARQPSQLARFNAAVGLDAAISASLLPEGWCSSVSAAFRLLRESCQLQVRRQQQPAPDAAPEGGGPWAQGSASSWGRRFRGRERPRAEVMAEQDYVSLGKMVEVFTHSFVKAISSIGVLEEARSASDEEGDDSPAAANELNSIGEWVFAALCFIEEPLLDDTQWQLQRLRRACGLILSNKDMAASGDGIGARRAAAVLHVIITSVFGQR